MMWKVLLLSACLVTGGLARPDVSHLLKKPTGDKQKRQNSIATSVFVTGNGAVATELRSNDLLLPKLSLLPLQENQPSPFRRLEERSGYDYQRPDFPLDVHPDSNLVSPVSTQAPEYLPPEDGEESTNVDKVAPPSAPAAPVTATVTTTSTTTTTPAPTTTTTTTFAPTTTNGAPTTHQEYDDNDGYGYKKPEVMLPTNINEVIGEPDDINHLATTTLATTTTTAKNSLEYLPPKPLPELVVPRGPQTTSTTQQPSTYPSSVSSTTTFQIPTGTQPDTKQPKVSGVYPDASATVSTVVTQQTSTELPSTSAPEYLPPEGDSNGFQIIVRSGLDTDNGDSAPSTTTGSTFSSTTTVSFNEPTTTLVPVSPEVDSLVQDDQTTEGQQTTTTAGAGLGSSPTFTTGQTGTPFEDTSSVIALINQMQEPGQVAGPVDFVPELKFDADSPITEASNDVTTQTSSGVITTSSPSTSQATTVLPVDGPEQQQPEARFGFDEPTGPSLIDLLTPTTTVVAVVTQNDTITTYHPVSSSSNGSQTTDEVTTEAAESSADETEIQSRIADPNDGYNYGMPENGLTAPSMVVPSHTLDAEGYHYKVPSVPFP